MEIGRMGGGAASLKGEMAAGGPGSTPSIGIARSMRKLTLA